MIQLYVAQEFGKTTAENMCYHEGELASHPFLDRRIRNRAGCD